MKMSNNLGSIWKQWEQETPQNDLKKLKVKSRKPLQAKSYKI